VAASTLILRLGRRSLPAIARRLDLPLLCCAELVVLLRLRNAAWTGYFIDPFTLLYDSSRILHGQVPYRDFFEFVGPGTLWLQAAWMALFGVDADGAQVLLALVLATLGLGLYVLSLHLGGRRPLALFAPAFVLLGLTAHWPWPSHHWCGDTAMVGALLAVSVWLRSGRDRWLVVAGAACAVTALFLQTYGAALVVGLAAFLLIHARAWTALVRWGAAFAAGLGLALAPVLAYFERVGGLGRMVYDTLLWPPEHYVPINRYPFAGNVGYWLRWGIDPATSAHAQGRLGTGLALAAANVYTGLSGGAALVLPLVAIALGAFLALESFGLQLLGAPAPADASRNLLAACGLVMAASLALTIHVRADMLQIAWATIAAYPVLVGCAARLRRRPAVLSVTAIMGALVAAAALWFVTLTSVPSTSSIDELASRDPLAQAVRTRTAPGDRVAFVGFGSLVYFYGRPAAIGHTVVLPMDSYTSADEIEQVRREVAVNRPRLVIFGVGLSCPQDPGPGPAGCLFPLPADYGGADGSPHPDRLIAENATWWIYIRHGPPATPQGPAPIG